MHIYPGAVKLLLKLLILIRKSRNLYFHVAFREAVNLCFHISLAVPNFYGIDRCRRIISSGTSMSLNGWPNRPTCSTPAAVAWTKWSPRISGKPCWGVSLCGRERTATRLRKCARCSSSSKRCTSRCPRMRRLSCVSGPASPPHTRFRFRPSFKSMCVLSTNDLAIEQVRLHHST